MKYWVNFSNGATAMTSEDLSSKGYTECSISEFTYCVTHYTQMFGRF